MAQGYLVSVPVNRGDNTVQLIEAARHAGRPMQLHHLWRCRRHVMRLQYLQIQFRRETLPATFDKSTPDLRKY